MKRALKKFFMLWAYLWLRFDPIIRITFRDNWEPRADFMKITFGEEDTREFLKQRGKKVKTRDKQLAPIILPSHADKKVTEFLKQKVTTKAGKLKRKQIIDQLIFWATDKDINRHNIESYRTRSAIVENLLTAMFLNSLLQEGKTILEGLRKIVFSRTTYLGSKGEPSPIVHDVIIRNVGRLLALNFEELIRLRDEKLEKMTKIKIIKEIQKTKAETGSFAFSGLTPDKYDEYRHKFPLEQDQADLLIKIIQHYRFSAWPDSRQRAEELIENNEKQLGFSLEEYLKQS